MEETKDDSQPILEDQLDLSTDPPRSASVALAGSLVETSSKSGDNPPKSRPWYKRRKSWLIIALVGVLLSIGSLVFVIWRERTVAQEFYSKDWRKLIASSELVVTNTEHATYSSFGDVEKSLLEMQNKIDDSQEATKKISDFLTDKDTKKTYLKGLEELDKYVAMAKDQASNLKDANNAQFDELKSVATATKLALEDTKKQISYLQGFYPDDFFTLHERYEVVTEAYQTAQDEEKAKQDAMKSKEDQAKQDRANAEEAVSLWIQAYISANATDMRKYMTTAFSSEYDFSQVSSNSRQYNYPTTYRRVNTDKKNDQYEIIETITFVSKSDYSADTTYTQTYAFLVMQDPVSKKWLINSQRYQ